MHESKENTEFVLPKNPVNFQCTKCGACCSNKNLFISVTIMDLVKWFRNGDEIKTILSTVGFYIFNEKDKENLLNKMLTIPVETEKGPAFLGMIRKENGECIMLDEKKKCKIYSLRPISCRQFPVGFAQEEETKVQIGISPVAYNICEGLKKGKIIKKKEMIEQTKLSLISLFHDRKVISEWNEKVNNNQNIKAVSEFLSYIRDSHAFDLDSLLTDILGNNYEEEMDIQNTENNKNKSSKQDKYSHIKKKINYRKK